MPCYSLDGIRPLVDAEAFVHPSVVLIGQVTVGARCYIGPGASLRGDFGRVTIRAGANVQDQCVLHCFPDQEVLLEEDAHIGHAAVLHGCVIQRNALVGIQAVVLDGAVVGADSIVGAGSLVPAHLVIPPRKLAIGAPCRIVADLNYEQLRDKERGTALYQALSQRCRTGLVQCEPERPGARDR